MTQENYQFTAEVGKVLQLMIHSIYTNKDIFVRELISNSSDACDKLRFLSQTDSTLLNKGEELSVEVAIDKDKREIYIIDNGIGMSKEELIENLGTIAKSGTQAFLSQISGDKKNDTSLIGQFGVGFYSAFMIADKISVLSKKAGSDSSNLWESDGIGEYSISNEVQFDQKQGTKITLHVKEGLEEYLDHFRVKHIIKTYSDHISVPVFFIDEAANKVQVNSSSALWMRNKSDISEEQYLEFYKSVSFAPDKPWVTLHNKNEGLVEYTNLLFIPSTKTFDLFHPERKRRVKLYIKRVFITDENVDLIPHYMRFLRGIIDSEDLPLNISRESLQHNATIDKIRNSVVKKVMAELIKKKEDDRENYEVFWRNFGAAFKEGLCEISPDQEKLLDCSLFFSCKQNKLISLDDYISSLPQDHDKVIYYLSGEDPAKLKNSPQIEGYLAKNIDVLIFTDPVDDFWVNVVNKYKEYEIRSVTRASSELNNQKSDKKDEKEETREELDEKIKILEFFKNTLGDGVKEVIISKKLTSSPVCLSVGEGDMDIRMERFLIEQKQLNKGTSKILEINLDHPIIKSIAKSIDDSASSKSADIVWLLFDQACVIEGEPVKNPIDFSNRLVNLMSEIGV
jgi:molecular chaperone HtpG